MPNLVLIETKRDNSVVVYRGTNSALTNIHIYTQIRPSLQLSTPEPNTDNLGIFHGWLLLDLYPRQEGHSLCSPHLPPPSDIKVVAVTSHCNLTFAYGEIKFKEARNDWKQFFSEIICRKLLPSITSSLHPFYSVFMLCRLYIRLSLITVLLFVIEL